MGKLRKGEHTYLQVDLVCLTRRGRADRQLGGAALHGVLHERAKLTLGRISARIEREAYGLLQR